MSRRLPLCLIVLGLASQASASPIDGKDGDSESHDAEQQLGDAQLSLSPRRDLMSDLPTVDSPDPYYRLVGFAQLTGGRGGGDVGAGAAAAVAGLGCDVLAGTAQGRFHPFDEGGAAAGEATYSVCLSEVLLTTRFDGRRGMGIIPGLDARRSLWSRRYDEQYDRIKVAVGEYWNTGSPHHHTIASVALGHGTTTQRDGTDERAIKELDLDFVLYRYRHRAGVTVEALTLDIDALKAGEDNHGGVTNAFMPLRVRFETPALYVAARGGWGWTGGTLTASGSMSTEVNGQTLSESSWSDTIDGEGLPELTQLVGEVEAGVHLGRVVTSAALARTMYPTFDGNFAREARISGSITYLAGRTRRTRLTLSPFAARTRTWTRDSGAALDSSAGVSLYVGHALADRVAGSGFQQVRVDAIAEAALSPYARLDGDRLPDSTFASHIVVALSGRVGQ